MKLSLIVKLALTSFFALIQALSVHAQTCTEAAAFANGNSDNNDLVNTYETLLALLSPHRVSKRKKIVVHYIDDPVFNGCRVDLKINITVKRKLRRDAKGNIYLRGYFQPTGARKGCLYSLNVHDVRLSHLTGVGEWFYGNWIKDWFHENYDISNICFKVDNTRRGLRAASPDHNFVNNLEPPASAFEATIDEELDDMEYDSDADTSEDAV